MLCLGILPFMQLDSRIGGDGVVKLYYLVIDTRAKDVLRQTTADRLSNLQRRDAALVFTD